MLSVRKIRKGAQVNPWVMENSNLPVLQLRCHPSERADETACKYDIILFLNVASQNSRDVSPSRIAYLVSSATLKMPSLFII